MNDKLIIKALRVIIEKQTNKGEEYPEILQEIEDYLKPTKEPSIAEKTHDAFCEVEDE